MMIEETTVVEEMPDIDYNDLIAMTVEANQKAMRKMLMKLLICY